MPGHSRLRRELDLAAYYDNEVDARARRALPAERLARRTAFVQLLHAEDRRSLLEIGSGAGRDGEAFARAGLAYVGVDLAPRSAAACAAMGLDVRVASFLELPFDDESFDALWTMSTLLHVPSRELDTALSEIVRVVRHGAPVAIGLWGAEATYEELWDDGSGHGPPRFFSFLTDDAVLRALRAHGEIERWETWPGPGRNHYQWAVVRTPRR